MVLPCKSYAFVENEKKAAVVKIRQWAIAGVSH